MRFTIRTKLVLGFCATLLLSGAAGGLGYSRLETTRDDMEQGIRLSRMATLAQQVSALTFNAGSLTRTMVIQTDDQGIKDLSQAVQQNSSDLDAKLADLSGLVINDTVRQKIGSLRTAIVDMRAVGAELRRQAILNSSAVALGTIMTQGRPALSSLRDAETSLYKAALARDSSDVRKTFSVLSSQVERLWGEVQGAIGAADLPGLRAQEAEIRDSRAALMTMREALLRSSESADIPTADFVRAFDGWLAVADKAMRINTAAGNLIAGDLATGDYTKKSRS